MNNKAKKHGMNYFLIYIISLARYYILKWIDI